MAKESNMITLIQDSKGHFRLVVDGMKVYNDQTLTLASVLEMVRTQRITEDLILELEHTE